MNSSSQSEEVTVTTENAVAAFVEVFVDFLLPSRPSKTGTLDEQQHQAFSKQLHAVVILYNHYHRKRHPELEFLGFESFCKLIMTLRPDMTPYMSMHQSDFNLSDVSEDHHSLTEKAIMNACRICLALDVPEDVPIKENWPISKIVVFLVDSSIKKCLVVLGSETQGIWSLLEKSVGDSEIKFESVWRNKRRKGNNKDIAEEEGATEFTHKQLAFSAIKELKGTIEKAELVFLESHVVYSLSQEKTAVRFYIVKCTRTVENVKPSGTIKSTNFEWADINEVLQSMKGPLVENISWTWFAARPAEHLHLLPYAGILSNFISRFQEYNGGDQGDIAHFESRIKVKADVPVDVLDERYVLTRRGDYRQYLVQWYGRSAGESTWISATKFQQLAPDLLERYLQFSSTEPNKTSFVELN